MYFESKRYGSKDRKLEAGMAKGESRISIAKRYCGYLAERVAGTRGIRINHDLGNYNPKDSVDTSNVNGGKRVQTDAVVTRESDMGDAAAAAAY